MTLIDKQFLLEQSGMSHKVVRELCHMFEQLVPKYLESLRDSFQADNREQVRHYAHKAKSAFGYLALHEQRDVLQEIENGIRDDISLEDLRIHYEKINKLLPQILEEVHALREELGAQEKSNS